MAGGSSRSTLTSSASTVSSTGSPICVMAAISSICRTRKISPVCMFGEGGLGGAKKLLCLEKTLNPRANVAHMFNKGDAHVWCGVVCMLMPGQPRPEMDARKSIAEHNVMHETVAIVSVYIWYGVCIRRVARISF